MDDVTSEPRDSGRHSVRRTGSPAQPSSTAPLTRNRGVGNWLPKKPLPCLGCGDVILTDRAHRFCKACSERNARVFTLPRARLWQPDDEEMP